MPKRGSILKKFLLNGLTYQKYNNLFWIDKDESSFALNCTHKSNRTWMPEDDKIYEDWVKVKTKGLEKKKKCSDHRQRLRVAMSKSQFLTFIKLESNYRIYKFVEDSNASLSGSDGNLSDCSNATSSCLYEDNTEIMMKDIELQKFQDIGNMLECNELDEVQNIDDVALTSNVMKEVPTNDSEHLVRKHSCKSEYSDMMTDLNFDDIVASPPPLNSENYFLSDEMMKDLEDMLRTTENGNDLLNEICNEQPITEVDTSDEVGVASQCSKAMPLELTMELSVTGITDLGDYIILVGKKVHQGTAPFQTLAALTEENVAEVLGPCSV